VVDTATANAEVVGTGNYQQTRRELGLSFLKPESVDAWVKAFRVYMGAYVTWEDGVFRLIPDKKEFGLTYALSFDGNNQFSRAQVNDTTTGDTFPLCIEFNYKMTQVPIYKYVLVGKKRSCVGPDLGWVIYVNNDKKVYVAVTLNNGTLLTVGSTNVLVLNQSVHIAVNLSNGPNATVQMYIDDTLEANQTGAAPAAISNSVPMRFGENDGG
jgi:hypothetical protein